jgi:hypothetical protein
MNNLIHRCMNRMSRPNVAEAALPRLLLSPLPTMALVAGLLLLHLAGCGSASVSATRSPAASTQRYVARVSPLNRSGVSGMVDVRVSGTTLVVQIDVTGLVPSQRHFQHIHGAPANPATCPTSADANASGTITLTEALLRLGPVAFDLQPYPFPDASGALHWSQTYTMTPDEVSATSPWTERVVVFHGMITNGAYDRLLPAACGQIQAA